MKKLGLILIICCLIQNIKTNCNCEDCICSGFGGCPQTIIFYKEVVLNNCTLGCKLKILVSAEYGDAYQIRTMSELEYGEFTRNKEYSYYPEYSTDIENCLTEINSDQILFGKIYVILICKNQVSGCYLKYNVLYFAGPYAPQAHPPNFNVERSDPFAGSFSPAWYGLPILILVLVRTLSYIYKKGKCCFA